MQFKYDRSSSLRATLVGASILVLGACASLDATGDVEESASLLQARSGIRVEWRGPWAPGSVRPIPAQRLGATDAARLALQNHAGIRAAVESITQARADYVQAHLLPNPILNFTLGFTVDGGPGHPAMAGLLQPLAALWQRPAAIDAATSRLRATVLGLSNVALELVADAKLAHARLVFAERDLVLVTRARDLAAESSALVEQRLAEGEASRLDRNRAELDRLDAETRLSDAHVRLDRARRSILQVCGVADQIAVPTTDDAPAARLDRLATLTERDVTRIAQRQRLDLAAARALTAGRMDETRLAELRRIPEISAGAGYQRNFSGRKAVGPSVGLEIPIFDDGRAEIAKAGSVARAAAAEAERVRQAAIADARTAFVQLRGTLRNLKRLRESVLTLSTESRNLAEQSFDAGIVDRGTVIALAQREVRTLLAANQIELQAVEWCIELERAVGGRIEVSREGGR